MTATCNIGPAEVQRRLRAGFIGLGLSIAFGVISVAIPLETMYRWLMVFPLSLAISGFVQAKVRFCMAYGFQGVRSLTGLRQFQTSPEIHADRLRALRLVGIIFLLGFGLTVLFVLTA